MIKFKKNLDNKQVTSNLYILKYTILYFKIYYFNFVYFK